jgi:hydrogenase maturation protease
VDNALSSESGFIVVGLGSPIRRDDRVGLEVARLVHARMNNPSIEFREMAVGGIQLVESLIGYDRAIVVDAIQSDNGRTGDCYRLELEALSQLPGFTHQFGLMEGLELGRRLRLHLPSRLSIWVVEVVDPYTISTEMTEEVERAVPLAVETIFAEESEYSAGTEDSNGLA